MITASSKLNFGFHRFLDISKKQLKRNDFGQFINSTQIQKDIYDPTMTKKNNRTGF